MVILSYTKFANFFFRILHHFATKLDSLPNISKLFRAVVIDFNVALIKIYSL